MIGKTEMQRATAIISVVVNNYTNQYDDDDEPLSDVLSLLSDIQNEKEAVGTIIAIASYGVSSFYSYLEKSLGYEPSNEELIAAWHKYASQVSFDADTL